MTRGGAAGGVTLFHPGAPTRQFSALRRLMPQQHVERLLAEGFPFYRSTFWSPLARTPQNIFEQTVHSLRPLANPSPAVTGAEWWFSVLRTNTTPQWLLPCHFDRNDLAERDLAKISHPEKSSVLFLNAVPYGELVITDQLLTDHGARPAQPTGMVFVRPRRNLYAVFPGQLHHGVIGRMWRPQRSEKLRVTLAVNWWAAPPTAAYMHDSSECLRVLKLVG
jgi:hypothetical protein